MLVVLVERLRQIYRHLAITKHGSVIVYAARISGAEHCFQCVHLILLVGICILEDSVPTDSRE